MAKAIKWVEAQQGLPQAAFHRPELTTKWVKVVSEPDGNRIATVRTCQGTPPDGLTANEGDHEFEAYVASASEGEFIQVVPSNLSSASWSTIEGRVSRLAYIVECKLSTGYAKCYWATGSLTSPDYDDSTEFYAFIGKTTWYQAEDYVLVSPVQTTDVVSWMVTGPLIDPLKRYNDPEDDSSTLASPQDSPSVHSHCTDTVEP